MDHTELTQNSEETLRVIMEFSPEAITTTDMNGTITDANIQAVKMHGFGSKADLIGENALQLIDPSDHEKAREYLRTCARDSIVRNVEYTLVRCDGSIRKHSGATKASVIHRARDNDIGRSA